MFSSFINRIYFLSPSSEKLHKHFEFFSHLHFDVCFLFICIFNKRNSKQFSFKLLFLLTAWRLFHFPFFNFHLPHQSENSDLRKTSPTCSLCPVVALTNRRPFSNTARGLWKFHQCYVKFSLEIALESEKCLRAHTRIHIHSQHSPTHWQFITFSRQPIKCFKCFSRRSYPSPSTLLPAPHWLPPRGVCHTWLCRRLVSEPSWNIFREFNG